MQIRQQKERIRIHYLCVSIVIMTDFLSIVPQPQSMQVGTGYFNLTTSTAIYTTVNAQSSAELLADLLRSITGFDLPIVSDAQAAIRVQLQDGMESEAYQLLVTESHISLLASSAVGLFYAIQTLRQLLPLVLENASASTDALWQIPVVSINDEPRFAWRGLHLDVGRHFYDIGFIKKFIDHMASYKYNIFHWHLTEDQGWRIEIKQYPKLTEIGSHRRETPLVSDRYQGDGKPYGGFYTQDEIREVVTYAATRHITIVPEIEMPGHALAALASYPDLGCVGEGYAVRTTWGIEPDVFCAGKEDVFTFLENVLSEVLTLFPSEFIHVGGDECPKERWKVCPDCQDRIQSEGLANEHELQSYFIRRMEKWINKQGRRLIGWDEILEGGLAPNATVMSWRGSQGGIDAANAGHDVVMSPTTHCYFDYNQSAHTQEVSEIKAVITLGKVYEFQPIPDNIHPNQAHHILGGQGNIWTEYMPTPQQVEYMTYPRALALAEVLWTYPEKRDFTAFMKRLQPQLDRLEALNMHYRPLDTP